MLVKFKDSPATFRGKPSRKHLNSLHGAAAAEFVAALPTKAQASLERVQGQVLRAHPSIGLLRVKLPAQISVGQAIDTSLPQRGGGVCRAQCPDHTAGHTPNDPLFANQWGFLNNGTAGTAGADIKALDAWGIITGGNNAIVAVIDSGVDYYHEDLAFNMWINTGEIPGNNHR